MGELTAAAEREARKRPEAMVLCAAKAPDRNRVRVARPDGIGKPAEKQPKET